MTAVIRLEDIMKTYVMGDAVVHALDHVSVEIGVGEFTSIMGPSGSGKSTMMNNSGLPGQTNLRTILSGWQRSRRL